VEDEKLLLSITDFQLNYLKSILPRPTNNWTAWFVPKEALPAILADIQAIDDHLQFLGTTDDSSGNTRQGYERKIIKRKASEIGLLRESFKAALADYNAFEIELIQTI
jgi:hypothetical protein